MAKTLEERYCCYSDTVADTFLGHIKQNVAWIVRRRLQSISLLEDEPCVDKPPRLPEMRMKRDASSSRPDIKDFALRDLDTLWRISLTWAVCSKESDYLRLVLRYILSPRGIPPNSFSAKFEKTTTLDRMYFAVAGAKVHGDACESFNFNDRMTLKHVLNYIPCNNMGEDGDGLALLHYAVMVGSLDCVQALFQWGADLNIQSRRSSLFRPKQYEYCMLSRKLYHPVESYVTPLWIAVALGHYDIAGFLLKEATTDIVDVTYFLDRFPPDGGRPDAYTVSPWQLASMNKDGTRFMSLLRRQQQFNVPIPLEQAMISVLATNGDSRNVCLSRHDVRWERALRCYDQMFRLACGHHGIFKEFLQLEAFGQEDYVWRKVILQYCLMRLLYVEKEMFSDGVLQCLNMFIAQRVSLTGWDEERLALMMRLVRRHLRTVVWGDCLFKSETLSVVNATREPQDEELLHQCHYFVAVPEFVCTVCIAESQALEHRRQMKLRRVDRTYRPPCMLFPALLPAIVRFAATGGRQDDPALERLLEAQPIPWLKSLSQIPFVNGKLHNGPTCLHALLSNEQREVPFRLCTARYFALSSLKTQSLRTMYKCLSESASDDVLEGVQKVMDWLECRLQLFP
eukprot:scpid58188/ scgid11847/ 